MKILILEDEDIKFTQIDEFIMEIIPDAKLTRKKNWIDYQNTLPHEKFDLILLDLLVPRSFRDNTIDDHYESLIDTTRDYRSKSFTTPAIVLTQQPLTDQEIIFNLNLVDINVIHFNAHGKWRDALKHKLLAAKPAKKFDVVILCALEKEAQAYEGLTDTWGEVKDISGLVCREVKFGEIEAVIIIPSRMGLVSAAVSASYALDRFQPRLICMSGICGGVLGESEIYDLLVSQSCHQHDAGKYSSSGLKAEHYDVQLEVEVHNKLIEVASGSLMSTINQGLNALKSEIPNNKEKIECKIITNATTSSGSAVMAEHGKTSSLSVGQRKLSGFDMEVFSLYEAARHARKRTVFFAAKSVVDDGGENKGDKFHRIGCLLSARFIVAAIRSGIADLWNK